MGCVFGHAIPCIPAFLISELSLYIANNSLSVSYGSLHGTGELRKNSSASFWSSGNASVSFVPQHVRRWKHSSLYYEWHQYVSDNKFSTFSQTHTHSLVHLWLIPMCGFSKVHTHKTKQKTTSTTTTPLYFPVKCTMLQWHRKRHGNIFVEV